MMIVTTTTTIIHPPLNVFSLCGRHFVYISSFNFLSRLYKSGNCDLARLNHLTDVTQPLSDSSGIWTKSGESHACYYNITSNNDQLWGTGLLLRLSNPYSSGNWGRAVLVNPPNNKESPSQHKSTNALSLWLHVNHKQHLGISETLLLFQKECPVALTPAKISPRRIKTVRGCGCWYYFPPFVFCLLTDICYHAKQVFLCKRTCPVCVSPSSPLRTQMSSVIKNPVNFWKETDGYPTRT